MGIYNRGMLKENAARVRNSTGFGVSARIGQTNYERKEIKQFYLRLGEDYRQKRSVVQAIYDAVIRAFQAQGPLPNGRQTYDTAEGAPIAFVYDGLALSGHDIETAFPVPGQTWNTSHQPVLRP